MTFTNLSLSLSVQRKQSLRGSQGVKKTKAITNQKNQKNVPEIIDSENPDISPPNDGSSLGQVDEQQPGTVVECATQFI
jgi:hypothetical protein